uniref:G_PROTEIN_RECEP_F1_2 domain-containing protein n=1 Tax=Meloidogyne hapla TaxID=6305 RepID=A0A1I8C3F4_MELHA
MIRDLPVTLTIFLCTPIYVAVIVKFVYEYKTTKNTVDENTLNDKTRVMIVCLVSLIPCPLYLCFNPFYADYFTKDLFNLIILTIFTFINQTILQCSEEIILLAISKEFRQLVICQFAKTFFQTKVVPAPVIISETILLKQKQKELQKNKLDLQNI